MGRKKGLDCERWPGGALGQVGMLVVYLSLARGLSPLLNFPDRLSVK